MNVTSTINSRLSDTRDRLEEFGDNLPVLPKKAVAYNRVAAERVLDVARPVAKVADTGVRAVVGTTRWAVQRTAGTAATGARAVVGQTKGQLDRTATTLDDETSAAAEEITDRVKAAASAAERATLRSMTKAELYQMAQDIDLEGRASMTKGELIDAIDDAG